MHEVFTHLTGKVNGNGTAELYAVTSTVSASGDRGADPNKLVKAIDLLNGATLQTGVDLDHFTTIRAAAYGEVLRGIALAPKK